MWSDAPRLRLSAVRHLENKKKQNLRLSNSLSSMTKRRYWWIILIFRDEINNPRINETEVQKCTCLDKLRHIWWSWKKFKMNNLFLYHNSSQEQCSYSILLSSSPLDILIFGLHIDKQGRKIFNMLFGMGSCMIEFAR